MIGRCVALVGCVALVAVPVSRAAPHPFPRFGAGCVREAFLRRRLG